MNGKVILERTMRMCVCVGGIMISLLTEIAPALHTALYGNASP
jgi:hypothetical protein